MALRIEWIRELSEVAKHEEHWVALENTVKNRTLYCCYDYIMPWYRCYAGSKLVDGGTPLVGLAWDEDRLVGVAPMIDAKASFAKVPLHRTVFAGYNLSAGEFLLQDGAQEVAVRFVESLREDMRFDLIMLIHSPVSIESTRLLEADVAHREIRYGRTPTHGYAVADLRKGFDEYNMSFGWKFRSRNKHVAKKINEAGAVRIDRVTSMEDSSFAARMRERMVAIRYSSKRTRVAGTELVDMHVPLYDELFDLYCAKGQVDLAILSIDSEDVAFNFGLTERGIYYHTSMSFAEKWAHLSPGKYLLHEVFRYLPDSGLHTVLSHGSYAYKNRWASELVPQENLCLFGRSLRARLAYWAEFKMRQKPALDTTSDRDRNSV